MLLSGILSRPRSPLASEPPEVEVPLPLLLGRMPLVLGLASENSRPGRRS
jgi:hypothetical protein